MNVFFSYLNLYNIYRDLEHVYTIFFPKINFLRVSLLLNFEIFSYTLKQVCGPSIRGVNFVL